MSILFIPLAKRRRSLVKKDHSVDTPETEYDRNKALFWALMLFYMCLAVIAVIGNGLVLYASYGTRNTGRLRYLDDAIRSLAVADMLFGMVGTPLLILWYYMG